MSATFTPNFTAFAAGSRIAAGSMVDVALAVKAAHDAGISQLLVLDDQHGRPVEFDLRGSADDVRARLETPAPPTTAPGRGRPKLGVTAREVTLLPSHWEWLATQPGGASAALRRLVDEARRAGPDLVREAGDAAYRVMSALAGNAPHFEEATRAFFAKDYEKFDAISRAWDADIGDYVRGFVQRLAQIEADTRPSLAARS